MATPDSAENPSLEEQVAALQTQLAQAQRLTALGELSSTITHEFNNILTTTINYAKLGLRHKDSATRDKALQKILDASQRAAKITATILGAARNRTERLEPTDLVELINDVLVLLERDLSKYRVRIEKDLPKVPRAMVNASQIQQVLINLLVNARQAMPNGGSVLVAVRHDAAAGMVDVIVRDSGTGIPAELLPKIFDPFFPTKSPDAGGKGGTGLGLSLCRNLVESHRGRIRVESTVGRGTKFTVRLPQEPAAVPAPHLDSIPDPAASPEAPAS